MADRGRVRVEPTQRRVRVLLGGETIADSSSVLMVWEVPYYPTYYFPAEDVKTDLLVETGETRRSPSRGEATQYVVKAGTSEGAAYSFPDSKIEEISGHYAFVWKTMDHWFEENEEVYVHARNPYTRIDILPSDRRVRVEIDGVTVADSTNTSFLFETGLPVRYYIPKTDYWSVNIDGESHDNVVWGYDTPLPESQKVGGLVAFYNERVDIYVDEVLHVRPSTKFS
jgi:uncharacterized protein (DUF427 family)